MALNITHATFGGRRSVKTTPLWQYDYGQKLVVDDLTLPAAFEVHFSRTAYGGETVTQIGTENTVTIPDTLLTNGTDIYAWIFLHEGLDDGETVYMITIPVKARPEPKDAVPTPEEQSEITQAIAALAQAVEDTAASESNAEAWAVGQRGGQDVENTDPTYHNNSKYYAEQAGTSETNAAASERNAAESKANAARSETNAASSERNAAASEINAGESAAAAHQDADRAEQAAGRSGYMRFYIDENGHLHYQRTSNVQVDFYLEDGHLYVRASA